MYRAASVWLIAMLCCAAAPFDAIAQERAATLSYVIAVRNDGPDPATGVQVTDSLPPGARFVSGAGCSAMAELVTCGPVDVEVGRRAEFTITVTVPASATPAFNRAQVSDSDALDPDSTPANCPPVAAGPVTEDDCAEATFVSAVEVCGNCVDDDGNGLIDFTDPQCCDLEDTVQVQKARLRPWPRKGPRGTLRVRGQIAPAGFEGVDPRITGASVLISRVGEPLICCVVPPEKWMKLTRRRYGFWDQRGMICPPLADLGLDLRRRGRANFLLRTTKEVEIAAFERDELQIAFRVGDRCAGGPLELERKRNGSLAFP